MKLDIKDKIDLDFFNRLQQAKSDNQDSMCDLYQRNILKPNNKNTEHITPLTLTKELERPKIVKQQELQQRKAELEQDKKNIEAEAKTLLKQGIKLKDLSENTDLTDKVNNIEDIPILKDIISKYISIDKALNVVIQQAENVDIQSATNVNINEIKNATVKTYQQLEEFISKADISEKSQKELIDGLAKMIGIVDVKDDTIIKIKYLLPILPDLSLDTALKLKNEIISKGEKPEDGIEAKLIKDEVGEVEFKNMIPLIKNQLLLNEAQNKDIVNNFIKLFDIRGKIKEILNEDYEDIIDKLFEYFREPPITYDEACDGLDKVSSAETLKTFLQQFSEFSDKKATLSGVGLCRCYEDYVLVCASDDKDFKNNIFGKAIYNLTQESAEQSMLKGITIQTKRYYVIITTKDYLLKEESKTKIIDTIQKMLSLNKTDYFALNLNKVNLYFKYQANASITNTETSNQTKLTYKSDVITSGGLNNFFRNVNKLQKYETDKKEKDSSEEEELKPMSITENMTSTMEEADGLPYSGKLDLSSATLDEKLNEIIQILSRMNYNVFTTTPMYKETKNKFNKESSTKKTNKDSKSKGIKTDLLTELGLNEV